MKNIVCILVSICLLALTSCGKEKEDHYDKIVGDYSVVINPNISADYNGSWIPISIDAIKTKCSITKMDDSENFVVVMEGINGLINEMVFNGYYDGLGLKLLNSNYDGTMMSSDYGMIFCDMKLKNPTVSIYNSSVLTWESTITGKCEINLTGLDNMYCDVKGTLVFEATK